MTGRRRLWRRRRGKIKRLSFDFFPKFSFLKILEKFSVFFGIFLNEETCRKTYGIGAARFLVWAFSETGQSFLHAGISARHGPSPGSFLSFFDIGPILGSQVTCAWIQMS